MITKGLVKAKTPDGYYVRIPYLETPSSGPCVLKAMVASEPPISEGYAPGDVVYVSFEDHDANKPVIIGLLSLPGVDSRGKAFLQGLEVSGKATLPENTEIGGIAASSIAEAFRKADGLSSSVSSLAGNLSSTNDRLGKLNDDLTTMEENGVPILSVSSIRVPTGRILDANNPDAVDSYKGSDQALHGGVSILVRLVSGHLKAGDEICICDWHKTIDTKHYTSSDGTKKSRKRIRYRERACAVHVVTEKEESMGTNLFEFFIPFKKNVAEEGEPPRFGRAQNFFRTTRASMIGRMRCVKARRSESSSRNSFHTISNVVAFQVETSVLEDGSSVFGA